MTARRTVPREEKKREQRRRKYIQAPGVFSEQQAEKTPLRFLSQRSHVPQTTLIHFSGTIWRSTSLNFWERYGIMYTDLPILPETITDFLGVGKKSW
jgi:hypothetical protein